MSAAFIMLQEDKMRNKNLLFGILALVGCVVLVLWAAKEIKSQSFPKVTVTVRNVVQEDCIEDGEHKTQYNAEVIYRVDGEDRESVLTNVDRKTKIGDRIEARYDPEKIEDLYTSSTFQIVMLFVCAFICLAISVYLILGRLIRGY